MTRLHLSSIRILGLTILVLATVPSQAFPVSGQGTWESTLQPRDLDGNLATIEAYYDTALGITWLADANYAQTSGYDSDGLMDWRTANLWATTLNIGGVTGWRLPTAPANDPTCGSLDPHRTGLANCTGSEMGHLYYVTLGNTFAYTYWTGISGFTNTGPFRNLQAGTYWTGSDAPAFLAGRKLTFSFQELYYNGMTGATGIRDGRYAWAVHDGDIGGLGVAAVRSVPAPETFWLLGAGLAGLLDRARRRQDLAHPSRREPPMGPNRRARAGLPLE